MEMTSPAYVPSGSTEARADVSPQTTMVVRSVIDKVIKVLKTANVDPTVIEQVKAVIIDTISTMVSAGTLQIPSMVSTSEVINNMAIGNATDLVGEYGQAKNALDGLRMGAGMAAGAGDTTKASEFIREVFTVMTGSADNVPEVMVQGFATKYAAGTTYEIGLIVGAASSAVINRTTGASVNMVVSTTEVLANVNQKLNYLYTSLEAKQAGATFEVDIPPVILAVFPPAQKLALYPVLATTKVTVPQMLLIVQGMMDTIQAQGYDLNPAVMCQAAGITLFDVGAGQSLGGLKIMHAEVRTTNYVAWGDNDTAPV
ncbi:MAG: hypothetical protein ABH860_01075, partial [bacterium]